MIATPGGTMWVGRSSPNMKSATMAASTISAQAAMTGRVERLRLQVGRQRAPDVPDVLEHERHERDQHQDRQDAAERHLAQVVGEAHADRAPHQVGRRVADQREQAGRVADDGGHDHGPDEVHIERPRDADDDGRQQDDGRGVGEEGAEHRHQDEDPEQEAPAAAARGDQEAGADVLEEPGRLEGAGDHHAPEEQRERPPGGFRPRRAHPAGRTPRRRAARSPPAWRRAPCRRG